MMSDAVVSEQQHEPRAERLLSLDAFRGMTIAGMILVNNPGRWDAVYAPLKHAEWHGWTPTDLIFPFFLFIVGVSIALSFARRAEITQGGGKIYLRIIRRALLIFALGLLIHGFPYYDFSTIRIPGVLQRIAVCYLFAAIIYLKAGWRVQAIAALALLVLYWVLMTFLAAPGFAAGDLSREANLAAYIDRTLLAGHIYTKVYDPEGILSTLPAIATTLAGTLTGAWLRSRHTPLEKTAGMFVAGALSVMSGWALGFWFPINKPLWTSSYVVLTTGLALQLLAICYWLIDIQKRKSWARPFLIFGTNAIAVYVLSAIAGRALGLWQVARRDGSLISARGYVFENLFAPNFSPAAASLAFSLAYVLVWLALMWVLYRRRIFIKV